MNASFDFIMRTGKCYALTNYGEVWKFEVITRVQSKECYQL